MLNLFAYPIGILLKLVYNLILFTDTELLSAYSLTIILTTVILKLIILPLTLKQTKSMKEMNDLQPKLKELQEKYKNDLEQLNKKTIELYKEHNANPLGGFLPLLLQFPIIIGFYNVIRDPLTFVFKDPETFANMNKSFLWVKDLSLTSNHVFENGLINGLSLGVDIPFIGSAIPVLAILAGITTYLSSEISSTSSTDDKKVQQTQQTLMFIMPFMIFIFALNMPEGLTLYWIIGNLFQIIQQYLTINYTGKIMESLKQINFREGVCK